MDSRPALVKATSRLKAADLRPLLPVPLRWELATLRRAVFALRAWQ